MSRHCDVIRHGLQELSAPTCTWCQAFNSSMCVKENNSRAVKTFETAFARHAKFQDNPTLGLSSKGIANTVERLPYLPPELALRIKVHLFKSQLKGLDE